MLGGQVTSRSSAKCSVMFRLTQVKVWPDASLPILSNHKVLPTASLRPQQETNLEAPSNLSIETTTNKQIQNIE